MVEVTAPTPITLTKANPMDPTYEEPLPPRTSPGLDDAIARLQELAAMMGDAARNESIESVSAIGDELSSAAAMVAFHMGLADDRHW